MRIQPATEKIPTLQNDAKEGLGITFRGFSAATVQLKPIFEWLEQFNAQARATPNLQPKGKAALLSGKPVAAWRTGTGLPMAHPAEQVLSKVSAPTRCPPQALSRECEKIAREAGWSIIGWVPTMVDSTFQEWTALMLPKR